ncbi:hypothetical protein B0T16DRAFT_506891 [Cercophora newfieldiana]|uniref:Uncharacterized protein n=1 Tax=Cercophora newfieldiana TaxID=92897 RepID=A0AA40CTK3_9PEZI|nr:hypothetical protein B0T16DRAFT_506891 [Cercophora newfieldiana]
MSGTSAATSTTLPYKGGVMSVDKLSKGPHTAPYNEQVLRFVLLAEMLRDSGLCSPSIRVCLAKYVKSLGSSARDALHIHLPNTQVLDKDHTFEVTVKCLSTLGKDGNLPAKYIADAMRAARLRLAEDPEWFSGPNGWFLWTAFHLAKVPVFVGEGEKRTFSHREETFWFGEMENALWLADVARIRLSMTNKEITDSGFFTDLRKREIAEAWLSLFGLFWDQHHNKKVCRCPDAAKKLAHDKVVYTADMYYLPEHEARVSWFEEELSDIVGLDVTTAYSPDLPSLKLRPYGFSTAVFKLHWRDADFLALRERIPELAAGLSQRVLALIKGDNPAYKHVSWKRAAPAPLYVKKARGGAKIGSAVSMRNDKKGAATASAPAKKAAPAPATTAPGVKAKAKAERQAEAESAFRSVEHSSK